MKIEFAKLIVHYDDVPAVTDDADLTDEQIERIADRAAEAARKVARLDVTAKREKGRARRNVKKDQGD